MKNTRIAALSLLLASAGCSLFIPADRPQLPTRSLFLWMPGASSVQVLADWNEWGGIVAAGGVTDPRAGDMTAVEDGFWVLDISHLRAGSYRYVFLVNGHRWVRDPSNPHACTFDGQVVSRILIPD